MCLSVDEMSNERIREAIDFWGAAAEHADKEGALSVARQYRAKVRNFKAVLDMRGVPLIPQPEPVSVEQVAEIVGELNLERELVSA